MEGDGDEDVLGSISGLGLSKLLASEGVDPNALSSLLSRTGAGPSSHQFASVDAASDDEEKFEDDVSDAELPAETEAERQARARERAEEARYRRRALAMAEELKASTAIVEVKKELDPMEEVKRVWPTFERGTRLRMSDILYQTPREKKMIAVTLGRKKRRKLEHDTIYNIKTGLSLPDFTQIFLQPLSPLRQNPPGNPIYTSALGRNFDPSWIKGAKDLLRKEMTKPPPGITFPEPSLDAEDIWSAAEPKALDLADWEKDIVMSSLDLPKPKRAEDPLAPKNDALNSGDWLQGIVWDANRLTADLLESDDEPDAAPAPKTAEETESKLDPFNLSNDHIYEQSREARFRIRQTFGAVEVFHSQAAKQLQLPWYKTSLTKTEARSWRRPAIQLPINVPITFHKLKHNPSGSKSSKKKQTTADPSDKVKSTKDLTLSEKGPYVLLEFSEEYPPIMSGYGMGTTMVNYYRKKDEKDETIPKLDFGQPAILEVTDANPYLIGYVDRGKVSPMIHNNLIRAPIFKHQPETTDFLVVRQTINSHPTYYLRAIKNLYTVGQTAPNQSEVFGPHARKNTTTSKLRLMIVAWLLIQNSKHKHIKLSTLMTYFPDQSELQMRQRLKIKGNEFLIYPRAPSPHVGYWCINPDYDFPKDRAEVRAMCSPEAAMLYEAMLVGQRHLYDAGYTKTAEGNAEEEMGDDSTLDIEQQLAVWETTKTYKLAEASKAWLMIHGEGDPTGRGEGFSFLRANMKNYFLRKGETEAGRRIESLKAGQTKISNSEQNQIYEEERRRVWDLQWKALSNPVPPELGPEDGERIAPTPAGFGPRFARSASNNRAFSRGHSMVNASTPYAESPREPSPSAYSGDGESHFTGNPYANKVMRIKRVVRGKEQFEIVRDPAVILSYMKRVEERKIMDYMKNPEMLQPTGNAEEDELKKVAIKKAIEKVRKNQERRLARRKYQARNDPSIVFDGDLDTSKRKCSACGQIGHTRANRSCPMYNANAIAPSPVASTPAIPTPGAAGYADYFAQTPGSENGGQTPTTFKIRLGNANR